MSKIVIEIAKINLLPSKTKEDLLQASQQFQQEFVVGLKGFISRDLVHLKDNEYADIIHWETKEDADAVMELAMKSEACKSFFSIMDMSGDIESGVTHYQLLESYSK